MDERQRVVKITDADNKVQLFEYDGVNKTVEIDKRGHRTEFRYDRINRFTELEDALGQTIATDYRDAARQVVETDKKRFVKTTQLDALGRLISVTRSGIRLEQHTYDGNSNRTLSTDANGNQTRFLYDGANRLTERIDGLASTEQTRTTFLYDDVGNLLEEKDGRDTGLTFDIRNAYDKLNRLETTTDAEGNTTSFDYDAEGNRTAVIEPKSDTHRTEFDYGELNELIEVRMPDGGVHNYTYDGNRNRIRQEDGESNVVRLSYDRLNRVDSMLQDPGRFNYITIHDYDANGNEIQLTDPKRQVIHFTYDELNRLDQKTYALTPDDLALLTRTHEITYHYDPNDNLERVDELKSSGTASPAIVSSFKTYDTLDRLTGETDAWGRTLTYDYDPQGNRTSLTDPDSVQTEYTFDALNRLETLTLEARTPNAQTVVYEYFPDSLKKAVTNPNATSSTYTYDDADRMETITHDGPGGVVSAYVYEYDLNGNRSQQIETNAGRTETTTYDYDRVNRLTVATYEVGTANATQTSYVYDKVGNRLTERAVELDTSTVTKDLTYDYDAINRLDTIDDVIGTDDVTYGYDPNGNTRCKTKAGLTTTFLFDIRDQLSEVRQDASTLGRYGYDYARRRILKLGDDGVRRYSYDQLSVITEADAANATVSKYDYGLDQLVSLDNTVEGRSFFHLDILRSTVSLSDAAGNTRQSIFYDAWGNERDRVGASANRFTFTGHEKDKETGLIYAKARFYDPDIGRFLNQDLLLGDVGSPPSLHRYAYVESRPTIFVDPTGKLTFKDFKEGFVGVFTEPFKQVFDVGALVFAFQEGIDPSRIELSSGLGRSQRLRLSQGKDVVTTALDGSTDVVVALASAGIIPFVQGQAQLAIALTQGEITIDEYEQGLSRLAGGATAVAVLAGVAQARAEGGWPVRGGRSAQGPPPTRGEPVARTATEPGSKNTTGRPSVEPSKGGRTKAEQLEINKRQSDAFEVEVVKSVRETDTNVTEQVSVKPNVENGKPADFRFRPDVMSRNQGEIALTEGKSSAEVRLTPR